MRMFDFKELGLISLIQTFSTSISLMQIGIVTGGFRLFSYKSESSLKNINNAVFIFFILLTCLLLFIGTLFGKSIAPEIGKVEVLFFIFIGVISLYANWVTCKLLGRKKIKDINIIQIIITIISLLMTISAYWFGIFIIVLSMLVQPLLLIILAYWRSPELIPHLNFVSFKIYFKPILTLGFIPYLTTAMGLFNSQFSRWLITFTLGTIILGKTSLPTLLLTIVNIFPAAISNLYFPRIIENYENNAKNNTSLRLYTFILVSYFLFVIIGVILFAKLLISFLLPKHIESLDLVYAILPALFFYNLSSPAILLFNAKKKFKKIFVGSLILMLSYFVFLIYYISFFNPNLLGFYIIESICSFIFFAYNIIELFKIIKTKNI